MIGKALGTSLLLLLLGCSTTPAVDTARCTSSVPNAFYTGPYKGAENRLSASDLALDASCAQAFRAQRYPNGFVAVYGSSRIGERGRSANAELNAANDKVYAEIRRFAREWTAAYGKRHPILTGAGPGLMEAASRGALDAGGPSIGYTTYYGPSRADGGKANLAYQRYKPADGPEIDLSTDGLIFTSVALRESMMIAHSAAIIVGPGGTGTEWEIFQILESMKSQQLDRVPIVLMGHRQLHWRSLEDRLDDMVKRGTVRKEEFADLFVFAEDATVVFNGLKAQLKLP